MMELRMRSRSSRALAVVSRDTPSRTGPANFRPRPDGGRCFVRFPFRLAFDDKAPTLLLFNEFKRVGTNVTDDLREDVLLRRRPTTTSALGGS
ncbi:hypothetical protein EVAR_92969_1 [Eumeta japonica]|uniref:Uncharacterized protein n=1 Tax=Eumeta variegata TaxID=151549 RepID=A0A4C1TDJ9_EUMVA|nr:hypothetical protein EVAR_92969_1 [Eumeta japonica]